MIRYRFEKIIPSLKTLTEHHFKMNHIPGPWMAIKYKKQNVKELGFLILQNRGFDETNIATVFKAIDVSEEQLEANAKLIAAAPELLEACKYFLQQAEKCGYQTKDGLHDLIDNQSVHKIIEAVKKATE